MFYVKCHVSWRVFTKVELSNSTVDHTHIDIEQVFSKTFHHLHHNCAVTFTNLHQQLRKTYDKIVVVGHMKAVAIWSGLCQNECVCSRLPPFTYFQHFSFYFKRNSNKTKVTTNIAWVVKLVHITWETISNDIHLGKHVIVWSFQNAFLLCIQRLRQESYVQTERKILRKELFLWKV